MAQLGRALTVAILLLSVLAGCAGTSWTCHYDGYAGTGISCEYQGERKFSTEVLPPKPAQEAAEEEAQR